MKTGTIVLLFVTGVVLSLAGGAIIQHFDKPQCTYSYNLSAGVITANCPITDAGLYDDVIVKISNGGYVDQPQRIADLALHLVTAANGQYVYTFKPPRYYPPNAWIMVAFSQ